MLNLIDPKQNIAEDRKVFSNSMLKAMILPLLIEQLLQMIVGLADTMMVSYAGEAVVAGSQPSRQAERSLWLSISAVKNKITVIWLPLRSFTLPV